MGIWCCGKKLTDKETVGVTILSFIVGFLLVFTVGYANTAEGDNKRQTATYSSSDPRLLLNGDLSQNGFNGLVIISKITNIDIPNFKYSAHFELRPVGSLLDTTKTNYRSPKQVVTVIVADQAKVFTKGFPMMSLDMSFIIGDGDANKYPFDSYSDQLEISASYQDGNQSKPIPVAIAVVGSLQSWRFDNSVADIQGSIGQFINLAFYRSYTTQFFSFIISVTTFLLALTLCLRGRTVEPPTIVVATGLLYAIPAIRNVQPGIPPIGCTADTVSLFWNVVLIASAAMMLLCNYIIKYKAAPLKSALKTDPEKDSLIDKSVKDRD